MSIRAIRAPLLVESENKVRSFGNIFALRHKSAKTRKDVGALLSQLPRYPTDQHAVFAVTLTRFSAGYLDDDNLRGAFKAVRDEVSFWLGVDDGDEDRIRFRYAQEPAPLRHFGIRIAIEECASMTPDHERDHGLGVTAPKNGQTKPKERPRPVQRELHLHRDCFAVLPWDQDGGDPVCTPLALRGDDPPEVISLRVPATVLSGAASVRFAPGKQVPFYRVVGRVEGKEVWLYVDEETKKGGEHGQGRQGHQGRVER